MAELIHEHTEKIKGPNGVTYSVFVCGESRQDGTWSGWIEFHPTESDAPVLRTGQETSQPNKRALIYWASGLEPIYLEGAFDRARLPVEPTRPDDS